MSVEILKMIDQEKINILQKILVPTRIKILELLLQESLCVCHIVEILSIKHNLVSHHLKTLLDLSIITNRKEGQHVIYTLNPDQKTMVNTLIKLLLK